MVVGLLATKLVFMAQASCHRCSLSCVCGVFGVAVVLVAALNKAQQAPQVLQPLQKPLMLQLNSLGAWLMFSSHAWVLLMHVHGFAAAAFVSGWHRGKVILTAAKQVAKWTLPSFICRDNLGESGFAVMCCVVLCQDPWWLRRRMLRVVVLV